MAFIAGPRGPAAVDHGDIAAFMARLPAARKRTVSGRLLWTLSVLTCSGLGSVFASDALAAEAHYTCSGGVTLRAEFSPPSVTTGSVALTFGSGRRIVLPQVMSADGGRYADSQVEFWIKGRNATLTRNGQADACSTQ